MHARILVLALISSLGSACLVPVDLTADDGGRGDGGDGGGCKGLEFTGTQSGATVAIPVGTRRTVSVFAPDGGVEQLASTGSEATFVPQHPGVYVVEVTEGGVTSRIPLPVDGALTGGMTRRYVNRIDGCDYRFTSRETLLCLTTASDQTHTVFVYDTQGQLMTQFDITGVELEVVGDEVWSIYGSAVEHRTETDAGLRLDGQFPVIGSRHLTDPLPGRVGVTDSVEDPTVFEVTWDGNALDAGLRFPHLISSHWFPLVLSPSTLWTTDFCRLEPGCQTMDCAAVATCDQSGRIIVGSDGPNVWVTTGDTHFSDAKIQVMTRALSPLAVTTPRTQPPGFYVNFGWRLGRAPYLMDNQGGRLVPISENGAVFFAHPTQFASAQERLYVELVDPFTLRFLHH